jgi:hypothetical protein
MYSPITVAATQPPLVEVAVPSPNIFKANFRQPKGLTRLTGVVSGHDFHHHFSQLSRLDGLKPMLVHN